MVGLELKKVRSISRRTQPRYAHTAGAGAGAPGAWLDAAEPNPIQENRPVTTALTGFAAAGAGLIGAASATVTVAAEVLVIAGVVAALVKLLEDSAHMT